MQDQHSLTVRANGLLRVIQSECEICAAFDPATFQAGATPPFQKFTAIWDTGAAASVITDRVVQQCGLKPTGMVQVHGVHGAANAETFLVNFRLMGRVGVVGVRVTRGTLLGCDALIGMDIINLGDFTVTNLSGKTVFSFRVPSLVCTDYVLEYNEAAAKEARKKRGPGGFPGGRNKGGRHRR